MAHSAELACFRHPDRALRDLDQLRSRLPQGLVSAALALIAECADPDQALNLFERLTISGDAKLISLLDRNRVLLHYILALFGQSYWLGEFVVRNPEQMHFLIAEKHLERSFGHEDFLRSLASLRSRFAGTDASTFLAGYKKREYIRIALRDVLGIATLAETTAELSALADVILDFALREAESQTRALLRDLHRPAHGKMRFAILSLGKLGGNELNYSSDLDLFYLYDADPSSVTGLGEYFTRQAQILTDILCRPTAEGAVFRIDLRLRPQGTQGEMASALHPAIAYYTQAAHDWELQALIKLRCSAGDRTLAREFITAVQPRVYTCEINFAAIDTALRSRERIGSRRAARGSKRSESTACDLKLDPGGIRDIEFLVQCLQRVYGGEETWLRSGGTLFSLQKLHDKGHISGRDFNELTLAYEFMRHVEHRLQLQRGQQTHRLPAETGALSTLHRSVPPRSGPDRSATIMKSLRDHMQNVQEIYRRIIFSEQRRKRRPAEIVRAPSANSIREMSFEQMLERIILDSPALHEIATRPQSVHTRRNLHRFLAAAMTTPERYAAVLQSPATVERAISLLAMSDYLTDALARHPEMLRVLDSLAVVPDRFNSGAAERLGGATRNLDRAGSLDALRHEYQKSFFVISAHDVLAPRPAADSMRDSSALADAAIRAALRLIGGENLLSVFALGRLGTQEFDIASDADLIFVRAADTDPEVARATAEKLVHALAAYTHEGSMFAVDPRLRPHGAEGELVVTSEQLGKYLATDAHPWEALTYTKIRFVAGREDVARSSQTVVWNNIAEIARRPGFAQAVLDMRFRLEKSNRYPQSFKLARGGFYDIDFLTSFLLLRGGRQFSGNTLVRLEHLHGLGLLEDPSFEQLRDAAILYRTTDHVIRLVTGRARPELPAAEHARTAVEAWIVRILDRLGENQIQTELNATATSVRQTFHSLVN